MDHDQEPLTPVDADGVKAVVVGTVLWAIALLVLLVFRDSLADDGRSWWIGVCTVGLGLGLAGIGYTVRRRNALRRADADRG